MAQSVWGKRFFEMLERGPVEKEYAISQLIGLVPPGQAWREYERTQHGNRRRNGRAPRPPLTPNEDGIRSGARQIVVASIISAITRGRVLKEEDANGRVTYRFGRDPIILRGEAKRAAVEKGIETARQRYGENWLSERATAAANARTPEERKASAMKGWLDKTPEQRAAIIAKGFAVYPIEKRAQRIREGLAAMTPEERSAKARKGWDRIDPEERHRRAMKGVETRRRRAWFREGSQRTGEDVSTGPEGGDEPDRQDREGGTDLHHAKAMG